MFNFFKPDKLFSSKARRIANIIGGFYLLSGFWEILLAETEHLYTKGFYFLDLYRNYAYYLGWSTFFTGILILCKFNIGRLLALGLAFWNIGLTLIIQLAFNIYAASVIKSNPVESYIYTSVANIIIWTITSYIRLYIISMLRVSKAGYIFLKKYKEEAARLKALKQSP